MLLISSRYQSKVISIAITTTQDPQCDIPHGTLGIGLRGKISDGNVHTFDTKYLNHYVFKSRFGLS